MKEIRIHARAGQGAITTAVLLSMAAFREGKHSLAFPHFGAERMGAPMNAYVRLTDGEGEEIRVRSQVENPDYVLVLDETLLEGFDVGEGVGPGGIIIIDSAKKPEELGLRTQAKVYAVPGSQIAMDTIGRPLSNTSLLGAFAAATGELKEESVIESVKERFPGRIGEANAQAVRRAYQYVKGGGK